MEGKTQEEDVRGLGDERGLQWVEGESRTNDDVGLRTSLFKADNKKTKKKRMRPMKSFGHWQTI